MSWGKQKSRVSFRNLLRNKKTAVIAAVCCVVAVGAYIGLHRPTSEAANEKTVRGVLSYSEDGFNGNADAHYGVKSLGKGATKDSMITIDMSKKSGDRKTMGTAENPFMVLELVPWRGQAEFPYYIDGCETADYYSPAGCYDKETADYYHSIGKDDVYDSYTCQTYLLNNFGSKVTICFEEEDCPGKDLSENDWDYKYRWIHHPDEEVTIKGYYEKVAGTSIEGNFVISGVNEEGRPEFKKVEFGKGDFIWVSLDNIYHQIPQYDKDGHVQLENKSAFPTDASVGTVNGAYAAGDREYTVRTDTGYWCMNGADPNGGAWENGIIAKCKFVHFNDFLRYSLQLRTIEDVEDYSIVVKPIEPAQLREHPEYIDYADLIWVHKDEAYNARPAYNNAKDFEIFLKDAKTNAKDADPNFLISSETDIGWEAAEKLFFKANALTKYQYDENGKIMGDPLIDYSGDGQFAYAPVILSTDVISIIGGGQTSNVAAYNLQYDDMSLDKSWPQNKTGIMNGFYKFFLMNTLMDADVFYDLFYTPLASTHKPVIQTIDGVGYNTAQEGNAQTYWCPEAFLPAVHALTGKFGWEGNPEAEVLIEKYKINQTALQFQDQAGGAGWKGAILGYTFIYDSATGFTSNPLQTDFGENQKYKSEAHKWFEEQGQKKDNLSKWDIVNFLLHYEKGGSNTTGSRTKKSIRSLEIEPGNDFYLNETSLKALFPASKYKMTIEPPVHMTTAEFNGSKIDLSEYDLVYVGTCRGKMNTKMTNLNHGSLGWYEEEDAQYNDANLTGKLYLHVGDSIKNGENNYRLAGTDITKEQVQKLKSYAKSGNVLVFADVLYQGASSDLYKRNVDISSNMHSLIGDVTSRENVVSLTNIKTSNIVSTTVKGSAVAISTPKPYVNVLDSDTNGSINDVTLNGNKLTFTFSIGYPGDENVQKGKNMKYGVRLYVDTNGDGIITEAEDGSEICTWDSDAETGAVYPAGTIDASGKEQPAKYTINYTIDKERKNGAIAWKFEVFSIDNENIKTVVSGVSRYNGYEENDQKVKNKINVLQVISTEEYNKSSSKANLEKELKKAKSESLFAKYAKDLDDYDITVTTIPLNKSATTIDKMGYLNAFAHVNSDQYDETSNSRENFSSGGDYYYPSEYKEYGVYLFSCGKEFEKADNSNGAVAFASWLSENGRSVIYTADSIYDADNAAVNGVTKLLKDSAGLSRYTSSSESTKKYNDTATYDKNSKAEQYESSDYNAYRNLEYTYNKLTETGQAGENTYLPFKNETWKKKNGSAVSYGSKTDSTDTLSQINKGTVCVYPYTITDPAMDILDRFEDKNQVPISGYTSQDYQLNLNDPMADVWYCLSGKEDTTYGISPNDAWNNYYLYNVDNVFYDGISLESSGTTKLEMQLFINILIGAYEASYKYPYITADKLELLPVASSGGEDAEPTNPPTEDELKIKLIDTSDEERNYKFSVSGVNSQFVEDYRYKEYKASAAPITQVTAAPTPTQAPTPTPVPTQDPDATPEPTATPAATPITLMENSLGSTYISWESKNAAWMKDLSNDAVIQITYRCSNRVDGSEYVLDTRGGYDGWNQGKVYTACVGGSTDSTQVQVVRMKISEFKQSFSPQVALTDDLQYVNLFPYNWNGNVVLLSVRLYEAGMDFEDINDPSIGTGGVSGGGDDQEEDKREKEVTGTDFLADTDTHKIYFTPYDGNLVGGNIRSVKLEFVSDKNNDANTLSQPINEVFREKQSGTTLKTHRIQVDNGGGIFAESDNRHLIDSTQYFIPFNKTYVNMYGYIKMTIWNKKKSSVTYIQINDQVTPQKTTKDVYMFDLD